MVLKSLEDHLFVTNYLRYDFQLWLWRVWGAVYPILFQQKNASRYVSFSPSESLLNKYLLHVACKHDTILGNVEDAKVTHNCTQHHYNRKRRHIIKIVIYFILQCENVLRVRVNCERDGIGGKISTWVRVGWPFKKGGNVKDIQRKFV